MELLLTAITIFASHPLSGLVVSIVFLVGSLSNKYQQKSRIFLGICAVLWLLFTASNYYLLHWRSPSGDLAIRVDLVLFGPIMAIITIAGVIVLLKGRIKSGV
jgi:hypothetical protein